MCLKQNYRKYEIVNNLTTQKYGRMKGSRSQVLEEIVREMWVRGLIVRDVEAAMITATGAFVLSDTAVSEVTQKLYEQYEAFRERKLDGFEIAYLFIDAVYEVPIRSLPILP